MNDLRQLRHFVALAEHAHFARAAQAVHLSQPALSRSIQALETSLDCTLIDRHSRGVSLTAHGQLVLEHAKRLLAGSHAMRNALSQLSNLQTGELRLGSGPYPAARLIPRALGQLSERYPDVRIELKISDWRSLREQLLNQQIELFIADIRDLSNDPLLSLEPLEVYSGVIFCRPHHPLLNRPSIGASDLTLYPLAGTRLPLEVEQHLGALLERRHALSIQCDNFMVLKSLVAESDVLSIAPSDVVAADVAAGRLATLPLDASLPLEHSAYGLVKRAGHSLSPLAATFWQQVVEQERHELQSARSPR